MTADPGGRSAREIATRPLFDLVVDLDAPLTFGDGPLGRRVLFGARGGHFVGERLRGEVVAGGGDWALFRRDGVMMLDVRLTLRTDDDALVHMTYGGRLVVPSHRRADIADPELRGAVPTDEYYFRTTPLFETGSGSYAWLNDIVCVGVGSLVGGGVAYHVREVR